MTPLAKKLFKHVRAMGVENMWEDRKSPNCVSSLLRRLPATKEWYPPNSYCGKGGRRGSCDVVFDGNWVEVKFAWTYRYKDGKANPVFGKHLLGPDESALRDVEVKLSSLLCFPQVKSVALLLVCFYSDSRPLKEEDIDKLETEGKLHDDGWVRSDLRPWRNPLQDDCWIRAYLWERCSIEGGQK